MNRAIIEFSSHHSCQSSLSSIGDDSSIAERPRSGCSTPSQAADSPTSPALTILARSSPEINALCQAPRIFTLSETEPFEFPHAVSPSPSPCFTKHKLLSPPHDESVSTFISSSWTSYNDMDQFREFSYDSSHDRDDDSMDEDDLWDRSEDPAQHDSCSISPDAFEDIALQLSSISILSAPNDGIPRRTLKRPTLHRRISFDLLPSPEQIEMCCNPPPPQYPMTVPRAGKTLPHSGPPPRKCHRRNTTQIILPPKEVQL